MICCWIYFIAWINHSCIVIRKLFVLHGSLHYLQWVPYAAIVQMFLLFTMILYSRIQLPVVYKQRDVRQCSIRWSIPPSIDYVWKPNTARLSWLLHAHIAYEIDTAKLIAAFCRIYYFFHDLIRSHSIVRHVQTTRCTMMLFSMIDSDINWRCWKCLYW